MQTVQQYSWTPRRPSAVHLGLGLQADCLTHSQLMRTAWVVHVLQETTQMYCLTPCRALRPRRPALWAVQVVQAVRPGRAVHMLLGTGVTMRMAQCPMRLNAAPMRLQHRPMRPAVLLLVCHSCSRHSSPVRHQPRASRALLT